MGDVDFRLACRMIRACAAAYGIGEPGGIEASPYYKELGFEAVPKIFQAGEDLIDACFVGTTPDAVVLAFRGTLPLTFSSASAFIKSLLDWHDDAELTEEGDQGIPGRVHRGFAESLAVLWDPLLPELKRQLASGKPLDVTGHSKGAALATLAAIKLLTMEGLEPRCVFPFASPRAGDSSFARGYDAALPQTWRFANRDDIVPHLPPSTPFVEVLERLPGSEFKALRRLPPFVHVQRLQFINWEGRIEGESLSLEIKRLAHMAQRLAELKLKEIAADHSSTGGYMVDTCNSNSISFV